MTNDSKPISTFQLPFLLAQQFIRDYDEVIKHYEADEKLILTEHFLQILSLQLAFQKSKDEALYQQYRQLEEALFGQFRSALKPYKDKNFHLYFDADLALVEKDIYSTDVFNSLTAEGQTLSVNAMEQFIQICINTLNRERDYLLLSDVSVNDSTINANKSLLLNDKLTADNDKEVTKARQLLAIYYMLQTIGVEHRESSSVSAIAKLVHLLTGTKLTSLQNSAIYKKYLLMPNYKQGESLIKDLKYIRNYFEDAGLQDALVAIDLEINRCIAQLPLVQRKKWQ